MVGVLSESVYESLTLTVCLPACRLPACAAPLLTRRHLSPNLRWCPAEVLEDEEAEGEALR